MRKGITPVVAVVLLIGLTVSAAGTVYIYTSSATDNIDPDTDIGDTLNINFESCWQDGNNYKYSIRNVHEAAFNSSIIDVFINSRPRDNYNFGQVIVGPQETVQLEVDNVDNGDTLRLVMGEENVEHTCRT
jgi:flagellin-like protein